MNSPRRAVAGLLMAAALFLAEAKPGNGEVITLAVPVRSLSTLTFLLGVEKGFYQREGLELRPVVLKPDLAVRSVVAGEADFTSAFGSVVRGAIAGLPVQGLMMLNDEQPYFLLAAKGITSIGQLKGKVVGIAGIGGTLDYLTRAALRKGGLDPDKDVQLIDINTPAIGLNALQAGAVAATMLSLPFNMAAEDLGHSELLYAGDLVKAAGTGVGATVSKITQRRDQVKRMLRATVRSMDFLKAEAGVTQAFISKEWKLSAPKAAEAYQVIRRGLTSDGRVSETVLRSEIDQVKARLKLKEDVPLSRLVDNSILDEILGERP
jgi:ABC-type nitrate/sulfonate/bicarbonate transport system substrate-binding protein